MNTLVGLGGAFAVGAGLAYVLDPDRGQRRRALAQDQLVSAAHTAGDAMDATARDVRNRLAGTVARVRSMFQPDEASDDVIVARVRAEMGGVARHAHAIEVTARDGYVTLRGPILTAEADRLLERVARVRGVCGVDNQLAVHQNPDGVPALQGDGALTGPRSAFMQETWSPTTRLLAGMGGMAVAVAAIGLLARERPRSEVIRGSSAA